MINVAKEFRLAAVFCDFANYGLYLFFSIQIRTVGESKYLEMNT